MHYFNVHVLDFQFWFQKYPNSATTLHFEYYAEVKEEKAPKKVIYLSYAKHIEDGLILIAKYVMN